MSADDITPGFEFVHPTQGACRVTAVGRRGHVRYTFGTPGWATQHYATTTVRAIVSLLDAGVLAVAR